MHVARVARRFQILKRKRPNGGLQRIQMILRNMILRCLGLACPLFSINY